MCLLRNNSLGFPRRVEIRRICIDCKHLFSAHLINSADTFLTKGGLIDVQDERNRGRLNRLWGCIAHRTSNVDVR